MLHPSPGAGLMAGSETPVLPVVRPEMPEVLLQRYSSGIRQRHRLSLAYSHGHTSSSNRIPTGIPIVRLSCRGTCDFFCGPLAGAVLIGLNYARLGKDAKGVLAFILGLAATTAIILTRWDWHSPLGPLGSDALAILCIICTWQFAKQMQGKSVAEHVALGGKLGATSTAFFIGVATLVCLLGVTIVALK